MTALPMLDMSEREDHRIDGNQTPLVSPLALARLIAEIRETCRAREDMMRAEQRLLLQAKAIQRRLDAAAGDQHGIDALTTHVPGAALSAEGDHPIPASLHSSVSLADLSMLHLEESRAVLHTHRLAFERRLEKLAKQLPIYPWAADVRGFGALGLAQIVGECGDLWNYANPAKVWKRLGLAVLDGERQQRKSGATAIVHGYSPRRRSIMWNIGHSLMQGNRDGAYRTYYLAEKERQRELLPDATQALIHNRAERHMTKRLLKHLWQAWRASTPRPEEEA